MKFSKKKLGLAMQEAAASFQNGQYQKTAALCKQILSTFPGHTGALGLLGVVSAMRGKFEEAIRLFQRAIKKEPANIALNKNLAKALMSGNPVTAKPNMTSHADIRNSETTAMLNRTSEMPSPLALTT